MEEGRISAQEGMATHRANQIQDQREEGRRATQERIETHRRNRTEDKHEIATTTTETLNGEIIIPELDDSEHTIGEIKHAS